VNRFQCLVRKAEIYPVLGIVLVAVLVRVVFSFAVFPHIAGPLNLGRDPDRFWQLAQNWVDGNGYAFDKGAEPTTYRGPGWPLVLAAVYIVFGDSYPFAVLTQCLIGSLVCLVMYFIGKKAFGSGVGYAAALIGALHPLLIWYSPRLRYEPSLTLFLALAVYWVLRAQDSGALKDALLTGVFLGCAALVNQVVILLPLALFGALLFRKLPKATLAKQSAVALLTMAAVVAPWTARNYRVSGGRIILVHSGSAMTFVRGIYYAELYHEAPLQGVKLDDLAEVHLAELLGADPLQFDRGASGVDESLLPYVLWHVQNEPRKLLNRIAVQIPRFWYLSESPLKSWLIAGIQGIFLLLALAGAFHSLGTNRHGLVLVLTVVYFNLVYAVFIALARFSVPVVPYVIILAVAGSRGLSDAVRTGCLRRRV